LKPLKKKKKQRDVFAKHPAKIDPTCQPINSQREAALRLQTFLVNVEGYKNDGWKSHCLISITLVERNDQSLFHVDTIAFTSWKLRLQQWTRKIHKGAYCKMVLIIFPLLHGLGMPPN